MHETLTLWHADHVNFARLLDLLEEELQRFHQGDSPQYELMLDIMYYMTHYPDVLHHPKEDLVFAIVKVRKASVAGVVDELAEQHIMIKELGDELVRDLDDIVNGSITPRARLEEAARAYITSFRTHMRKEEAEILPLAAQLLDAKDWSDISAKIRHIEDPLFGTSAEERYSALRRQIAREARA